MRTIAVDALDIREALIERIKKAPAGGIFHEAVTEAYRRNSFCLQLAHDEPIYTVTITVGGALTSAAK